MKKLNLTILLTVLMSMVGTKAFADNIVYTRYDIVVENADGVPIYYKYINDATELEVAPKADFTDLTVLYSPEPNKDAYTGDVVIPEEVTYMNETRKVTSIGHRAFYKCSGLTSVTIPNSVTSIGDCAFYGCNGLTSVYISDIVAWCNVTFYGFDTNPLTYAHHLFLNGEEIKDLVVPNGVTSIDDTFYGCSSLTSVTIPNSVTSIGHDAFADCSGLSSITIPNSVTSLGFGAFAGCSGLTSVTIPNSVTSIGMFAFEQCRGLTSITVPNSVTDIGYGAFAGCSGLTSITISNSLMSIESELFCACSNLTSVTIPNSVTSIGRSAFEGCKGLTSVTIPNSVTSIGGNAFYGCSGLKRVELNSNSIVNLSLSLKNIFDDQVTEYILGEDVMSIGYEAFSGCSGLTSVTIGNNVTSIDYQAFYGCSGLTSVMIPYSVTTIGYQAFYGCSGLTSVTIPNSVRRIDQQAFANCDILVVISKIEDPFYIYADTFSEITFYNATLYVPKGAMNKYKALEGWKRFVSIEEGVPSNIEQPLSKTRQIQVEDGVLTIQNIKKGTSISVFNANGTFVGSTVSQNEQAIIDTNMQPGSIAIVKIGEQSVKVIIK